MISGGPVYFMAEEEKSSNNEVQNKVIHADPTKDFFVNMITRDIPLQDCIFDLLDNAIDGARRSVKQHNMNNLSQFKVQISFDRTHFSIEDNCGGISLSDAIDYAFHFGRKPENTISVEGGIGLYGIGMKRAIFKMGRFANVVSETEGACFNVSVDVDVWTGKSSWDFEYEDTQRKGVNGTRIKISKIYPSIDSTFSDSTFQNQLIKRIAQDYAFFIDKELLVEVCGKPVPKFKYQLKESNELSPAIMQYEDDGVEVRIVAGLVDALPDEIPDELKPSKVERYGWFVSCNDRIVLAADKTDQTVWGDDNFQVWHPQYNGFAGFVFFRAEDQRKLPWTTTKRNIDSENPLFRRTLEKMKRITNEFIDYTNRRKADLEIAKQVEQEATRVDVASLKQTKSFKMPKLSQKTVKEETITISYIKTRREVDKIKNHLENPLMSAREVGKHTFEYFQKAELEK